jgi:signal transduction histidine kinase/ActR/RegA family two-component response regulator
MANLLIVDDEGSYRASLTRYLQLKAGWTVYEAATADEAIKVIESTALDGILLDRRMPSPEGMLINSGDELIGWLHNRHLLSDICVVLFTGFGEFESARTALRMGVWNYLQKPISPADIHRLLAPGIALKKCHRLRQHIITADSAMSVVDKLEDIVKHTLAPDLFRMIILSGDIYGDVARADQEDIQRKFVREICDGKPFLSAGSRDSIKGLDPLLYDAGSLMAVGVLSNRAIPCGVIVMESLQENAFDLGWQEVLGYLADLVGLSMTIRSGIEAERRAQDRELNSQRLLLRELRHRLATSIGTLFQQVEGIIEDLSLDEARVGTRAKALVIQKHATTMMSIIQELRSATTKLSVNLQPCNLADLVAEVVRETEIKCHKSSIAVALEPPKDTVVVDADPQKLEYCVRCVLWNAIESVLEQRMRTTSTGLLARDSLSPPTGDIATDCLDMPRGPDIKISVNTIGGFGEIHVCDQGIGFDEEIRDRLFTPLFTTKLRRGEDPSNDGIGLYTTMHIIRAMAGNIEAISRGPGTGAEFIVRLRLERDGAGRAHSSAANTS